jgi:hypothetical protein
MLGVIATSLWIGVATLLGGTGPQSPSVALSSRLQNPNMECSAGFGAPEGMYGTVPSGWGFFILDGWPNIESTQRHFAGDCRTGWVEHIEGVDSWAFLSQDTDSVGRPFDAGIYQQVSVTQGKGYSFSGWLVSECGGSYSGNYCTGETYMAKMLGLDPYGGTDPLSPNVVWVENRANIDATRWLSMYLGTTAKSSVLTVFVRIRSPYQHSGNQALVDAMSLVESPYVNIQVPTTMHAGQPVNVSWTGGVSTDIAGIPGGAYQPQYDLEYRLGGGNWTPWLQRQGAGSATLPGSVIDASPLFVRALPRAEQPQGQGVFPTQRYPGDWVVSSAVTYLANPNLNRHFYLPITQVH